MKKAHVNIKMCIKCENKYCVTKAHTLCVMNLQKIM